MGLTSFFTSKEDIKSITEYAKSWELKPASSQHSTDYDDCSWWHDHEEDNKENEKHERPEDVESIQHDDFVTELCHCKGKCMNELEKKGIGVPRVMAIFAKMTQEERRNYLYGMLFSNGAKYSIYGVTICQQAFSKVVHLGTTTLCDIMKKAKTRVPWFEHSRSTTKASDTRIVRN